MYFDKVTTNNNNKVYICNNIWVFYFVLLWSLFSGVGDQPPIQLHYQLEGRGLNGGMVVK